MPEGWARAMKAAPGLHDSARGVMDGGMSTARRILILGGTGRLGGVLAREWQGRHEVMAPGRRLLDASQPAALARELRALEFDTLVNTAGLTSPDTCEERPDDAAALNAAAPAVLAAECARRRARLIHLSTDYVFDGGGGALLDEDAPARPVNVYGRTKLAGEKAVLAACPEALVARVSWLFGPRGGDVPATVLERARSGQPLDFIEDKWSAPTGIADLTAWLERFVTDLRPQSGVLHLCHTGVATWRDYAQVTLDLAHAAGLIERPCHTIGRRLREFSHFKAARPPFTVMSNARLSDVLGAPIPAWQEALERHLAGIARHRGDEWDAGGGRNAVTPISDPPCSKR
ncbi:MAG TPA: hypothetical protein DIT64_22820 [Verrucomicrobiales bacterium]|nr:hypothetical protein [Verrucomicrobiales bacterium]